MPSRGAWGAQGGGAPLKTTLLIALLALSPALAGQKEFRAARKAYDETRERIEEGREKDPKKLAPLLADMEKLTKTLFQEDQLGAVEHLLDVGVISPERRIAKAALQTLQGVTDKRAKRAFLKAFGKAKGLDKILLVPLLATIPGKDVTSELLKATKEKDVALRAAAVHAIGQRGAGAKEAASG